jgi:hypothetical protein
LRTAAECSAARPSRGLRAGEALVKVLIAGATGVALPATAYRDQPVFRCLSAEIIPPGQQAKGGTKSMSILWIILIVVLVLALLGFFSRGYW